jgi:hypothetical protein
MKDPTESTRVAYLLNGEQPLQQFSNTTTPEEEDLALGPRIDIPPTPEPPSFPTLPKNNPPSSPPEEPIELPDIHQTPVTEPKTSEPDPPWVAEAGDREIAISDGPGVVDEEVPFVPSPADPESEEKEQLQMPTALVPSSLVELIADFNDAFTSVRPEDDPAIAELINADATTANIVVTYNGFTSEAQSAFEYAVNVWEHLIASPVTIEVNANWTPLAPGILGSAGPTQIWRDFSGAPQSGTWYPVALANKLHGSDLNSSLGDINANFSSSFTWYYGTDGNPPAGQHDLATVVLHELGHGLGFVGGASYDASTGVGTLGSSGFPYIYDRFTENGAGTRLLSYANPSVALGTQLTSGNIFFDGANARAANGGNRPELYAPSTWRGGSSYSHLDEDAFPNGTLNSLMTPFLSAAESIHTPGGITLGMFKDMGWGTSSSVQPNLRGDFLNVVPEPLNPGDTFDIQYRVENTGAAPPGNFYVDFFISTNNFISTFDRKIAGRVISNMGGNVITPTFTFSATLPAATDPFWTEAGPYYIGMVIDPDDLVDESNESDNSNRGEFLDWDTVDFPNIAPADLFGTNFNVVQEPLVPGATFDVDFTVRNGGGSDASAFDVEFYLSDNDLIASCCVDILLGTETISFLGNHSSTSRSTTLTLPPASDPFWDFVSTSTDPFYIGMIVDANGAVAESDETNNSNRGELIDYDGVYTPDLSGLSFDVVPEPLDAGDNFTVNFNIQNTAAGFAGAFDVDFYISTNNIISTLDKKLGTRAIASVAGNSDTGIVSQNLTLPGPNDPFWSGGSGTYYIGMIVDANNDIGEIDETNNSNEGEFIDYDGVAITIPTGLAIAATSANKNEGNSGTTPFTFTVTRSGNTTGANSVNWAVTGSGASPANATDFGGSLPSGTVNFAATETSKVITVNVSGDTTVEPDEGFTVTLSGATGGATITTAKATGTIRNDDVPPPTTLAIAATSANKNEGNSGITPFTFTVTRSGNTTGANSVNWAVTGSGASPANATDFGGSLPSGTVNFAATETSKVITVNVSGDATVEPDEGFTVTLSGATGGATITTATATGTIINDDGAPPPTIHPDFNRDGKRDLLWRNPTTGQNVVWYMEYDTTLGKPMRTDFDFINSVATPWEIGDTGDANGDGQTDIYFRNPATGQNVVWYMEYDTTLDKPIRTGFDFLPSVAASWEMGGIGNAGLPGGDGLENDIYWRNPTTGQNVVWYMEYDSGSAQPVRTDFDSLPSVATAWDIVGIGDAGLVGGDALVNDIYFRNSGTGQNVVWYMEYDSGSAQPVRTDFDFINSVATPWDIRGISDAGLPSGDALVNDIYFRNSGTGQNLVWYMEYDSGSAQPLRTGFDSLPSVAAPWEMFA